MTEPPSLSPPVPHTLAQFARRAGITHSYARKLYAATPSRLPTPDLHDADARPLWYADTIDNWTRSTGRPPAESGLWLYTAPDASAPATVQFHGIIEAKAGYNGAPIPVHAIVYGTEHGPLLYLTGTDHRRQVPFWRGRILALAVATELVAPTLWPDTLVVAAPPLYLEPPGSSALEKEPTLQCFRMRPAVEAASADEDGRDAGVEEAEEKTVRERLRHLTQWPTVPVVGVEERIAVSPAQLKRVLGMEVPLWLAGTRHPATITRARSYRTIFAVPDTVTQWPVTLARLEAAHAWGMAYSHPAAFTLLAADAQQTMTTVRRLLTTQPTGGDGWYLAARPELPELPLRLETALATLPPPDRLDTAQLREELTELRQTEAVLPADPRQASHGDALEHATVLLADALMADDPRLAVDRCIIQKGTMNGPVAQQWRATLHPHLDAERVLGSRRGHRLLDGRPADQVEQLLCDHADRLVALFASDEPSEAPVWHAEWPMGLPVGWDHTTVIAADPSTDADVGDASQPVLALTTGDGPRVDPVPALPPRYADEMPDFAFGYEGSGPATLYDALLRVVLDRPDGLPYDTPLPDDSRLWQAITSKGPLRLRWTDVQQWAHHDINRRSTEVGEP